MKKKIIAEIWKAYEEMKKTQWEAIMHIEQGVFDFVQLDKLAERSEEYMDARYAWYILANLVDKLKIDWMEHRNICKESQESADMAEIYMKMIFDHAKRL